MTKEYTFEELGYFCERDLIKLKEKMDGKTFFKFQVSWSNYAGNCNLVVTATVHEDTTAQEVKSMFMSTLISNL